ncbi:MAG: recombination protein RecR [Ruminococcus sp.]|nr:recombination protein RecR [Ruminococcus sp.]MBQ9139093.1 recombination protein RecR [Ruminococcus sp.]
MADHNALPLVILAEKFASLPGIGMKSAQRLAYHVMSMDMKSVEEFSQALIDAKRDVRCCSQCQNLTEREICPICGDDSRDHSVICVVESPKDVTAFERTREYNGVYHVLHGLLSPMDGITPDKLRMRELISRISAGGVDEVIMATNPTVEGDATALYAANLLKPLGVKVSRLAFGLPVGGMLEYADEVTLFKALENRNNM